MTHIQTDPVVELMPCPFCGGDRARTIHIRDGRKVACICGACGKPEFHGPLDLPDAETRAIAAWNTRATEQPAIVGGVDREQLVLLIERMCPDKPDSNFGHPIGTECEALADAILAALTTRPSASDEAEAMREAPPPVVEPFDDWIDRLRVEVVQDEYGYEEGEFNVYPAGWRHMWLEGLTAPQAFARALDAARSHTKPCLEPLQCPECGVGRPGHEGTCSRGTVITFEGSRTDTKPEAALPLPAFPAPVELGSEREALAEELWAAAAWPRSKGVAAIAAILARPAAAHNQDIGPPVYLGGAGLTAVEVEDIDTAGLSGGSGVGPAGEGEG